MPSLAGNEGVVRHGDTLALFTKEFPSINVFSNLIDMPAN